LFLCLRFVVGFLSLYAVLIAIGLPSYSQSRRSVRRPANTTAESLPARISVRPETVAPDIPSGFLPGLINFFAGNGNSGVQVTDGSVPTDVSLTGKPIIDSHGNVYIASDLAIYVVYGGSYIPAALANVTTSASPAVTPEKGLVYQVAVFGATCGPCEGLPLNQIEIASIANLTIDSADNIYYVDGEGNAAPFADVVRKVDAATSNVTTVAGQWSGSTMCTFGTSIGDGGPAASAILCLPSDVKIDSYGNVFIDDYFNDEIRVVFMGTQPPALFAAEGITGQKGYIYSVAGQAAYLCTTLGACGDGGPALAAGLGNEEAMAVDPDGNLYIADAMANGGDFNGYPYIRVVYAGGAVPPILNLYLNPDGGNSVTPAAGYIYPVTGYSVSTPFIACTTAPCGDDGLAGGMQFSDNIIPYITLSDATNSGSVYIVDQNADAVRKIDASGYVSTVAGVNDPSGSSAGCVPVVPGPAVGTCLGNPNGMFFDPQNTLYISGGAGWYVWKAVTLLGQTIDFPAFDPSTITYGTNPVTLAATASSGLEVQYAVSSTPADLAQLNGSELIVKGAGQITVTASQPGNDAYSKAPQVSQTLTVSPAPITVTANPASKVQGAPNPAFTASVTGFVNGDTAATSGVFSGAPVFSTTATTTSPKGTYPVTSAIGTLASTNYVFADFIPGTLTVTGSAAQSINFPGFSPSTVNYGQAPIALSATASSGATVSFQVVSGPGRVSGQNGSLLAINGAGAIVVQAIQEGNDQYAAASPVSRTLTVNPVPLTVTGPSVTLDFGVTVDPSAFPPAVITGFVGTDTQSSVLTGSAHYTTATGTPSPGTYPITVDLGTLLLLPGAAANYSLGPFVNGSLIVNQAPQSISFNPIPSGQIYGQQVQLAATATSGLPVTFTTTGPASQPFAGTLSLVGIGTVTVTATQAGDATYLTASPVAQTFSVGPAPLNITVANAFREQGAPNPNFAYSIGCTSPLPGCFVLSDTDVPGVISGIPAVTTVADENSAPGTYAIVPSQGTLAAPNYYFVFVNGTITVSPPGTYAISANPGALTITRGQSAQATLTITPANFYQGTVTLSCGQLPANVSCVMSPSTYTFPGSQNANGQENPAQGTVTINTAAGTIVGSLRTTNTTAGLAGVLIPGAFASIVLAYVRRRAAKQFGIWQLGILVALGLSILSLISCSSSSGFVTAAPGTVTVTITGSGTTVSGDGAVTASVPLTVTIQ
jgi:hypothetical protein